MKRVFITGESGYIASILMKELTKNGYYVTNLDLNVCQLKNTLRIG